MRRWSGSPSSASTVSSRTTTCPTRRARVPPEPSARATPTSHSSSLPGKAAKKSRATRLCRRDRLPPEGVGTEQCKLLANRSQRRRSNRTPAKVRGTDKLALIAGVRYRAQPQRQTETVEGELESATGPVTFTTTTTRPTTCSSGCTTPDSGDGPRRARGPGEFEVTYRIITADGTEVDVGLGHRTRGSRPALGGCRDTPSPPAGRCRR